MFLHFTQLNIELGTDGEKSEVMQIQRRGTDGTRLMSLITIREHKVRVLFVLELECGLSAFGT